MSILNDDRRISDDIWEFTEWLNEVKREFRGDNDYPEYPEHEESEDDDD